MKCFEELCRENYGRIYRYIYALAGDKQTAEDLIQDVFMIAFEKGDAFLSHENPPAFLYKTARNRTLTYLKRQRKYEAEYLDEDMASGEEDLCAQLLRQQDRDIDETVYAGAVVGGLDERQRALYHERYVEGRPIRDIALDAGVTETAMRMRLVRLRRDIYGAVKKLKLDEL